nr:hypothetical protein [Tanacetum cinerariifolium]
DALFVLGRWGDTCGESWVVVKWQGNRGKWPVKLGGKIG